jgi:hypothetical protein
VKRFVGQPILAAAAFQAALIATAQNPDFRNLAQQAGLTQKPPEGELTDFLNRLGDGK